MRGKPFLFLLLILTFFISSCDKVENQIEKTFKSEEYLNVSYAAESGNVMDVYLPANRDEDTKIVVMVHGGSWMGGDKSDFTEYAIGLRRSGLAVANINYRLLNSSGTIKLAEQQNDIKAAVNFVFSKASEWGVSNKIGLLGHSAGGHLALLYTYANNADGKVKTVVSLAGPTDLTDTRNGNLQLAAVVEKLVGASFLTNPQPFVEASPISKVTAYSKPTLLFHGKKDIIVPVQQSIDLKSKLDQANVRNKLMVYETTGHEVIAPANLLEFMSDVQTWLNENIN